MFYNKNLHHFQAQVFASYDRRQQEAKQARKRGKTDLKPLSMDLKEQMSIALFVRVTQSNCTLLDVQSLVENGAHLDYKLSGRFLLWHALHFQPRFEIFEQRENWIKAVEYIAQHAIHIWEKDDFGDLLLLVCPMIRWYVYRYVKSTLRLISPVIIPDLVCTILSYFSFY